jgi:pantothenate kinase
VSELGVSGPDMSGPDISGPDISGLAAAAAALVPEGGRAILGIAGSPGAGKSTLAELLVREVAGTHGADWVAHVPMDGFHLADAQLDRLGLRHRKGAPDTFDAAGFAALLRRIRTETDSWVYAPGFDRTLEQPLAAAMVVPPAARLIISEGNYLLLESRPWVLARAALDEVWFVTVEETARVERLVERHVRFGKRPDHARDWVAVTDGPNAELIEPGIRRADRVVLNGAGGWQFTSPPAR